MPERSPRCLGLPLLEWALAALARLPLRVLDALAGLLTLLLWPFVRSRRRVIATNLDLCFPELTAQQRKTLLRANVRSTVRGFIELCVAYWRPDARMQGWLEVEGAEHLQTVLAQGRGALLMFSHFHSLELCARLLVTHIGRPIHVMARPLDRPCLQQMIDRQRRRCFGLTIDKKRPGALLRSLKDGHPVVYAADQNFSQSVVFVPFFGQSAATVTATSRVLRSSGAAALMVWCHRSEDGRRYKVKIDSPLENFPSGDDQADAARWMAELEQAIRAHPEQYLWAHRRFRSQPGQAVSTYATLRQKHRGQ